MRARRFAQVVAYSLRVAVVLFPLSALPQTQFEDASRAQSLSDGNIPTIRTTTTLVFLDVTVLDKKGHPVIKGLTKDDFSIMEDKKPQHIFSFEEPDIHAGKDKDELPKTVLVLDLLNTSFSDFAYVRDQAEQFLLDQPETLRSETEMMVLGNQTLELQQGFTRSRADLLITLDHLPRVAPYKQGSEWISDRIRQSYIALQQIAAQNKGLPGRKNVMWIGNGSPDPPAMSPSTYDKVQSYIHHTVNMMVEARICLFLIYPRMHMGVAKLTRQDSELISEEDSPDPLSGGKFTEFVYETGGKVFDLNDVGREVRDSELFGSKYYTLTYQPRDDSADGGFRRIKVTLSNPDLQVMTKAGFYSREKTETVESDDKTVGMLTEAALAAIPMTALRIHLANMVRHPDVQSVDVTVQLEDSHLGWESADNGLSDTAVIVSAVSKSGRGEVLSSKLAKYALIAKSQDASRLAEAKPEIKFTLRLPRGAQSVRVAVATGDGSRIGSLDVSRREMDAAPEAPTPDPKLLVPEHPTPRP